MEFKIIVNKQANFYFFVQNLSEWHFSNRKQYNNLWKKELGEFSEAEQKALNKFKEIHLKYPFGDSYLGKYFFTEKNSWDVLKEKLLKKDFKEIKNIFLLLEEKFEVLYKKDFPLLEKWQDILNKGLNSENKKALNNILGKLYNIKSLNKDIDIFLLFSSGKSSGGGANINNKSITAEISRCHFDQQNIAIGIIWHELIHLHFEIGYFLNLLKQEFNSNKEKISFAREIINCLLLPNGILGKTLLKINQDSLHAKISIGNKDKLLELTEEYIKKEKKFDKKYIEKVCCMIKNVNK